MNPDPCCLICESKQFGICLTRGQCEHHRVADAQDEANSRARRTHRSPTEDQAIANVMRARRNPKRPRI